MIDCGHNGDYIEFELLGQKFTFCVECWVTFLGNMLDHYNAYDKKEKQAFHEIRKHLKERENA